jgi:hypothetical protein
LESAESQKERKIEKETGKIPFWRKQENTAKHGARLPLPG